MSDPKMVHEEVLMCGAKKCCPTVRIFADGSVELSDDDPQVGSVGTIKMRPETAQRFRDLLDQVK